MNFENFDYEEIVQRENDQYCTGVTMYRPSTGSYYFHDLGRIVRVGLAKTLMKSYHDKSWICFSFSLVELL